MVTLHVTYNGSDDTFHWYNIQGQATSGAKVYVYAQILPYGEKKRYFILTADANGIYEENIGFGITYYSENINISVLLTNGETAEVRIQTPGETPPNPWIIVGVAGGLVAVALGIYYLVKKKRVTKK